MRGFVLVTLLGVLGMAIQAQPAAPTPDAQLEQMKKLAWLVGSWEGSGWTEMQPGQKHLSRGTEKVESRLDGLVLIVEGFHRAAESDEVVHHALGMLSWDEKAQVYRFRTQLANGRAADATGHFEDGVFVWSPPTPPGLEIHYRIRQDEDGSWWEVGEMSRGDSSPRKFFEMRMKRLSN